MCRRVPSSLSELTLVYSVYASLSSCHSVIVSVSRFRGRRAPEASCKQHVVGWVSGFKLAVARVRGFVRALCTCGLSVCMQKSCCVL